MSTTNIDIIKSGDLVIGRVYRCTDGKTRKVLEITGLKNKRQVKFRDGSQLKKVMNIGAFARFCEQDVTPVNQGLVGARA